MVERFDNDAFFASASAPRARATIPEDIFYAGRPRPPLETPLAVRAAATPLRFAFVIFLVGWAGIVFQASFLQQVVVGAPVFEELAKLGPPLLVVSLLRIRSMWIRLPLAWISGAAFGVMEHFVTYSEESLTMYIERIAFHALTPGVSMMFYAAFEHLADVRARWASTVVATLFHWANNFLAVALGLGALLFPIPGELIGAGVSAVISGGLLGVSVAGIFAHRRFAERARAALAAATPRVAGTG